MIRGGGVPAGASSELVQNIDLLPSFLHFAGVELTQPIDGRLPVTFGGAEERTAAMTEVFYPGATYHASIKSGEFDLHLDSVHPVGEDGRLDLSDYQAALYVGRKYDEDQSARYPQEFDRLKRYALMQRAGQ